MLPLPTLHTAEQLNKQAFPLFTSKTYLFVWIYITSREKKDSACVESKGETSSCRSREHNGIKQLKGQLPGIKKLD